VESLALEHLKEQYEILLKSAPLGFDSDELSLSDAYKLVIQDHMGEKEFNKYTHGLAKKNKKYDIKKLVEANNGL
jgi:hypothetical protein